MHLISTRLLQYFNRYRTYYYMHCTR